MTTRRTSVVDEPAIGGEGDQHHPLAEAGEEAGRTAGHLAERAADVGFQQADRAREQTAEGLNQLASTVRRVSGDMEIEQPAIANLASTAAEQTERVASFLRETDARQLVHAVEDVARRQPLLFVGGAFLLGVAASRFIKAAGGGSNGDSYATYGGTGYRAGGYGSRRTDPYEATGPGAYGTGVTGDRLGGDPADEGLRP
ncbi:MAG TPA: hypothetical protein VLA76_11430 [Candidatus Angelobacter sp.]|nr:hypothetical protein [Candidatus Angelobacter sp.]